jgi:hypothetical protein
LIPRVHLERFAREHPRWALLLCLYGIAMLAFVVWLIVADWSKTVPKTW